MSLRPQNRNLPGFVDWKSFRKCGKTFLGLEYADPGRGWLVTDQQMGNYGAWQTLDEFRRRLSKGEDLKLE